MNQVNINSGRIVFSLLASGLTFILPYLVFLVLLFLFQEGSEGFAALYELFTQASRERRIHIFVMFMLILSVPVFVLFYGSAVYWLLMKYNLLSLPGVLIGALFPAVILGGVFRELSIFLVSSVFCLWHAGISWWFVVKKFE